MQLLLLAEANRATGMAGMNDRSSRSHLVVMVTLSVRDNLTVTRAGCSGSCRARGQLPPTRNTGTRCGRCGRAVTALNLLCAATASHNLSC
jgi:hypothetical protein